MSIIQKKTSPERVKGYSPGTRDWQAEYDMLLPDGVTCKNCCNVTRCVLIFGTHPNDDHCQFYPSRFTKYF
jgi:hypothetical protein